jgi:hypothetical protein
MIATEESINNIVESILNSLSKGDESKFNLIVDNKDKVKQDWSHSKDFYSFSDDILYEEMPLTDILIKYGYNPEEPARYFKIQLLTYLCYTTHLKQYSTFINNKSSFYFISMYIKYINKLIDLVDNTIIGFFKFDMQETTHLNEITNNSGYQIDEIINAGNNVIHSIYNKILSAIRFTNDYELLSFAMTIMTSEYQVAIV